MIEVHTFFPFWRLSRELSAHQDYSWFLHAKKKMLAREEKDLGIWIESEWFHNVTLFTKLPINKAITPYFCRHRDSLAASKDDTRHIRGDGSSIYDEIVSFCDTTGNLKDNCYEGTAAKPDCVTISRVERQLVGNMWEIRFSYEDFFGMIRVSGVAKAFFEDWNVTQVQPYSVLEWERNPAEKYSKNYFF